MEQRAVRIMRFVAYHAKESLEKYKGLDKQISLVFRSSDTINVINRLLNFLISFSLILDVQQTLKGHETEMLIDPTWISIDQYCLRKLGLNIGLEMKEKLKCPPACEKLGIPPVNEFKKEQTIKFALKKLRSDLNRHFGCSSISVIEHFADLKDERADQGRRHSLLNVIIIAMCAVICNADGWAGMVEFGKERKSWLESFLDLTHGIPSEDTFRRVFAVLNPKEFQKRFSKWIRATVYIQTGNVIAIDGKALRGCKGTGVSPKHIVNAWSSACGITLGQCTVDGKSNEITAIPKLLKQIYISGSIITIDAMGCQTKIASIIRAEGGHYILALKGNQGTLESDVDLYFTGELKKSNSNLKITQSLEKDHGRVECRTCWVSTDIEWLLGKAKWKDLKSIVRIQSERTVNGKTSIEVRYYISSLDVGPEEMLAAVRAHWGVESMHWTLDMAFSEDACRIRKGNSPENFNVLRHIALHLLKRENSCKRGIAIKRLKAAMSTDYLEKVLLGQEAA
jgi:predicted transposase YbfD/YdcC